MLCLIDFVANGTETLSDTITEAALTSQVADRGGNPLDKPARRDIEYAQGRSV